METIQQQASVPPKRITAPRTWRREIRRSGWAYAFISPFYILFAIFGLWPMAFSVYLSLTEWKGIGPMEFVAFDNYTRLVRDTVFWQSMRNGFILFFLYVPLMLFLALVLAVILNSGRVRGYRIFRTIIFMPFITNMIAAGFAFRILFTHQNGLVNIMLGYLGVNAVPWLESVWWAHITLSILILWAWLGYNMVIMMAGLQMISKDLTEAALVDGATPIQAFFRVTIPLMRPVILFTAVTSTIGSFGLFAEVASLTDGGPMNATLTPLIRIYNVAFGGLRFGYASALAYTYFAIIFFMTIFQVRYGRDR